jgi:hypothetical protein
VNTVILEHALLPVRPDRHADFEAAFEEARPLIAAMPGFRGSAEHQGWRLLLHSFHDPFPAVQHFETALSAGGPVGSGGLPRSGERTRIGGPRTASI